MHTSERIDILQKLEDKIVKLKKHLSKIEYQYNTLGKIWDGQNNLRISMDDITLDLTCIGDRTDGYQTIPVRSPEKTRKAIDAFRGLFYEKIKETKERIDNLESKAKNI